MRSLERIDALQKRAMAAVQGESLNSSHCGGLWGLRQGLRFRKTYWQIPKGHTPITSMFLLVMTVALVDEAIIRSVILAQRTHCGRLQGISYRLCEDAALLILLPLGGIDCCE